MHVVVAGGGFAGLFTALLLARGGHRVTIVERDADEPGEDPWRDWRRPGVPQLRQFHGFTALARNTLAERAPDVHAAVLAAGVEEFDVLAGIDGAAPWPDDPPIRMFIARRTTFEPILRRAVRDEPDVTWSTGAAIGLERSGVDVTGLVVDDRVVAADVVVDATGRRARSAGWLGAEPERHDTGIAYFTRWYRRVAGPTLPHAGARADLVRYRAVLTRADADHLSLAFMVGLSVDDVRAQLRDPAAHHELAMSIPTIARWIDPSVAEPASGVLYMGGLENTRWMPAVPGLVVVGDAAYCTNPFFARGTAFAFAQAAMLADDPATYRERALARFDPWFDDVVARDRARDALLRGLPLDDQQRRLNELATRTAASTENLVAWLRYIQGVGHPSDLETTFDRNATRTASGQ